MSASCGSIPSRLSYSYILCVFVLYLTLLRWDHVFISQINVFSWMLCFVSAVLKRIESKQKGQKAPLVITFCRFTTYSPSCMSTHNTDTEERHCYQLFPFPTPTPLIILNLSSTGLFNIPKSHFPFFLPGTTLAIGVSGINNNNNNNNFYLYGAIKSNEYNCPVALYNE